MADEALERALLALDGLSLGDAFGSFFEFDASMQPLIEERKLPPVPWHYTDDTNMALSIYDCLRQHGQIDQDWLAASFVEHFDPEREYEMGMRTMVTRMREGEAWRAVAQDMFWQQGSFGSGGAMRVAPVGAYFADDLERLVQEAERATAVTHSHPEGIAGALAVAVAAAYAWRSRGSTLDRQGLIDQVLPHVPNGEVKQGIERARDLPPDCTIAEAVKALGNGSRVSAQDTVPFTLWCAGGNVDHFEEAIWQAAQALGDVDTICAMVGAIVIMRCDLDQVPAAWLQHRENLPAWPFA